MYLNNVGFRARIMNIKIIHGWIRNAGEAVEKEVKSIGKSPRDIPILEMDELYTYYSKKDWQIRIWLAVDRNGNEIIAHDIGNGSAGSANELQVKHHNIRIIATDGNYSYNKIIPKRIKHIVDKLA